MNTETPQLAVSRVFDAPRALVFRAFTDPDHLATWWGPTRELAATGRDRVRRAPRWLPAVD